LRVKDTHQILDSKTVTYIDGKKTPSTVEDFNNRSREASIVSEETTNNLIFSIKFEPANIRILPFVSEVLVQKLKVALSADAAADPAEVPAAATGGPATPSPQTLPTTSWTKDAGGSGVKWDFISNKLRC